MFKRTVIFSLHQFSLAVLLFFVLITPACKRTVDLDRIPRQQAYLAVRQIGPDTTESDDPISGYLRGDFDGDGKEELAVCVHTGLLCFGNDVSQNQRLVVWQHNLPEEFIQPGVRKNLWAAADLDGDGADEVLMTIRRSKTEPWLLYVYDNVGGECNVTLPLPQGPDRNSNGFWDGTWDAVGVLPGIREDGGAGLLMLCQVGYDVFGRGMMAIDPRDGSEIWRFEMASNPIPWTCNIVDLDGDGHPEITVSGSSPCNLGPDTIGGFSDDRMGLHLLSDRGEEIWSRRVGAYFYGISLAIGDLDADGAQEMVIATNHHGAGDFADTLAVFNAANGDLLAVKSSPTSYQGLRLAAPGDDGKRSIYTCTLGGVVERLSLDGRQLITERRAKSATGTVMIALGDLLPDPGEELVLSMDGGRDLILDRDLNIRGSFPSLRETPLALFSGDVWSQSDRESHLIVDDGVRRQVLYFQKVNHLPLWQIIMSVLGLAMVALLFAVRWWRNRDTMGATPAQLPSFDQDILVEIYRDLEISSHGRFSILRSLRLLEERMGYSSENRLIRNRFEEQIGHSYADFTSTGYPALTSILERAEKIGFQPDLTRETGRALISLSNLLARMARDEFSFRTIVENLDRVAADNRRIEVGFRNLREAVDERIAIDPVKVTERLLGLAGGNLESHAIELRFENGTPSAGARCLIDQRDLRFVIENLIDNAIKAMQGDGERMLTVKVSLVGRGVRISVSDTGRGIDSSDRLRIFDRDFSTESEGGLGLWQSRQLMSLWRGELNLTWTEPGRGSCFTIQLHGISETDEISPLSLDATDSDDHHTGTTP
jgi:signal transduction histidine kinase